MFIERGNDLNLGQIVNGDRHLSLPRHLRDKHLYVCGATGTGKSKFLEHLIRQDILNWRQSHCGMLVLDPHGSLYDSVLSWMATHQLDRPVIAIDLRHGESIVSYNPLRSRTASPAVIVENLIQAMAHVWGQGGTDQTPLFSRWAGNVLRALYEKSLTLSDAVHVVGDPLIRRVLTSGLQDAMAQRDWQVADTLPTREFESQISSTINRLIRFLRNETMRAMFGQPHTSLDLGAALEEGHLILVSLSREGARVSSEDADLFATLLLTDLWTAAQERGKRKGLKPFYVYLDEFQRFVTPTIAENLDEARGYGLHLTLAHQFPNQLLNAGPHGKRVHDSIMENASSKVVFRLSHEDNLKAMALWLFRGVMDPDEIKHTLYSTKVMSFREEYRTAYSRTTSHGSSGGDHFTASSATGAAGHGDSDHESWTEHFAESYGESSNWSESESVTESTSSILVPVMGKELSHVQFRSLEEQLFRAMAVLFDQQQRQGVARLVGMNAPVSLFTPMVKESWASPSRIERYRAAAASKWPFMLPVIEAHARLAARDAELKALVEPGAHQVDEPVTTKRRIR